MAAQTDQPQTPYVFEPRITKPNLHDLIDACGLDSFAIDVDLQRMVIVVSIPAE